MSTNETDPVAGAADDIPADNVNAVLTRRLCWLAAMVQRAESLGRAWEE